MSAAARASSHTAMRSPGDGRRARAGTIIPEPTWRARAAAHAARADRLTAARRERLQHGETDEVEDFLYTYYSFKPRELRRWHPGAGVELAGASAADERAGWRWHRTTAAGGVVLDADRFLADRGGTVEFVRMLLLRTLARPARTTCSCMHEWAMVYHEPAGAHRHRGLWLRLGEAETDRLVDTLGVHCSHYDAYRFFTADAAAVHPTLTRAAQPDLEQPGCLHANMDVYKWAFKLAPALPGELLLDAFDLALRIRRLDMAASPYDVHGLGIEPVRVETVDGQREFAERQAAFGREANALRRRMLAALDVLERDAG